MTTVALKPSHTIRLTKLAVRVLVDVGVPLGLYYVLRAMDVSVYLSLLASTLLSVLTSAVLLIRHRRVDGLALYMNTMLVVSVGVSLIAGSPRFLLAKEAWLTGLAGVWFLVSIRAGKPLAYLYTKPMLEGRMRWPGDWDGIWERSPRFRQMWRVSSILWGIGSLADAGLRIVMAYTLPIDEVPGLATGLYIVTAGVLIIVTNIYYLMSRSPEWWPPFR
ncbi:MAG TPA: VC0807 family protein [Pseudonocardiaceae bacterium]|nr:VC0807 family protein [Pseudonocardiaceae bacterium]